MIGSWYRKKIQTLISTDWRTRKKLVIAIGAILTVGAVAGLYTGGKQLLSVVRDNRQGQVIIQTHEAIPAAQLKHLEKVTTGECKDAYKVVLPEKSRAKFKDELCTVGPDVAKNVNLSASDVEGDFSVGCYTDGTSGKRFQAIYAVASDKPDRYDELLASFRNWAGYADAMLNKSAQKTGGELHIKWVTDASCQLQVAKVILPPEGDDSFGQTIGALKEAGFNDANRKYMAWVEDTRFCGIGTFRDDDRHDPYVNYNDFGGSYSRVDIPCRGQKHSTELHEIMHNLGVVQDSAPNSTKGGHCTDEHDLMCYPDAEGVTMKYRCTLDQEPLLDCENNDYLHSNPAEGSYLSQRWNVFNSNFLYSKIPSNTVPPTRPDKLVGTATAQGIQLNWMPSTDDEGKAVTYKVFRGVNGGRSDILATTTNSTYLDTKATAGNTYKYFVIAYDPDGNASPQSFDVTITVPTTPLPQPDTTPPPVPTGLTASNISTTGFTLSWNLPADKSDIKYIIVLLNNSTWKTLTNTPSSTNHCCDLTPDTSYTVRLKTVDAAGNYALGSQITVKTSALPVTPSSNIPYNLTVTQVNGAEITLRANIDTTTGAYIYRVTPVGEPQYSDWLLPVTNTPYLQNFVHPQVHPQNITGFYISVLNSSSQEIGRTPTLSFSYGGTTETNAPSTPSSLQLGSITATSALLSWAASTDDSGRVYRYHISLVNNTTSTTTTPTGGYNTSSSLFGLQSGHSYTAKVRSEDIWGNFSAEGTHNFTHP